MADLEGALIEILRLDDDTMLLVLAGLVPAAPAGTVAPQPVARLAFDTPLLQPDPPALTRANGKVEFEEEDDEHEIEVEDLVPGAAYRVELRDDAGAVEILFDGNADALGDIRQRTVLVGGEPLPLGVASFADFDGFVLVLLDADGAVVLEATVAVPRAGGGAAVTAAISFDIIGVYDGVFLRGDTNRDFTVNLAGPIATLDFLFRRGARPACQDATDSNDDGTIDLSDAVFTLVYLFRTSGEPPYPGTRIAGFDGTTDTLFCLDR